MAALWQSFQARVPALSRCGCLVPHIAPPLPDIGIWEIGLVLPGCSGGGEVMEVEERYAASPHYDVKSIFVVVVHASGSSGIGTLW